VPTRKYALERGGPQRLEISWKGNWKNLTVRLDGEEIGSIADRKELKAGREFSLPDGSTLKMQLTGTFNPQLQILRNGEPLPGSASDPVQKLKTAYMTIFFVAGLNIVIGLGAALLQIAVLQQQGFGWGTVIVGCVYLALGFFVVRRSLVALVITLALFALDTILSMVLIAQQGGSPSVVMLILRITFLSMMAQGYGAIRTLKK